VESNPLSPSRGRDPLQDTRGATWPTHVRLLPVVALALLLASVSGRADAACPASTAASQGPESRRCALIEAGILANHEGRFGDAERSWQALRELDPSDPAAPLFEVETAWWRLVNDEGAVANDAIVRTRGAQAIELADARLRANPDDALALGQKGAALIHLARLDGVRGNLLKAGRTGEKGREALERAIALEPERDGSRYALGLYSYYTSVMPGFLKLVNWLWFVPKGDRDQGLAYLDAVAKGEGQHAVDAQFILMNIHTYHAPVDLSAALSTGRALHARYPDNALFHSELIEVLLLLGLYDDAIASAQTLEASRPIEPEPQARPQLARILRAQAVLLSGRADEAWRILEPMDENTTRLPVWGGAWLHLVRGQVHDARGERAQALVEYALVTGREGSRYNRRAALIAEAAMTTPFEPSAYRELPMISAVPD
jgi:tetratricopeptide (TPR) repeat protein